MAQRSIIGIMNDPIIRTYRGGRTITKEDVTKYFEAGLTYDEMVEAFYEEHGEERTKAAFAAVARRNGLRSPYATKRWKETVPWRVKVDHTMAYEVRMLRLLARRDDGTELTPDDTLRLDSFLRELDEADKVVHYDGDTAQGFWCVPREPQDKGGYIRRPPAE